MAKKLINLLIELQPEPPGIARLRKIAPVLSASVLVIFIILYIVSLTYIQINASNYNKIQKQVILLENKIAGAKASESLYISAIGVLEKIKNVLAKDTKIIANALPAIIKNQNSTAEIITLSIDNNGPAGFFVKTSSLESLEYFVGALRNSEKENNFKEMGASGILRENDGSYSFTVNLKIDKKK